MVTRRHILGAALSTAAGLAVAQEGAAGFPSKPIRIVVPFATGSASDTLVRAIGAGLGASTRWTVIVENKPGAGGAIGTEEVARAAPDGYTLVAGNSGSHAVTPLAIKNVKYDPERDFKPVTMIQLGPLFLVVRNGLGVDNLQQLMALARKAPGTVSFASPGTAHTLLAEDLAERNGVKFNIILYKGSGPALTDVIGGHVDVFVDTGIATLPSVKSGKVKVLAVTSAQRSPQMPEVPTIAELGNPGFDDAGLTALFAPAGTPDAVIRKLNAEIRKVVAGPEIQT